MCAMQINITRKVDAAGGPLILERSRQRRVPVAEVYILMEVGVPPVYFVIWFLCKVPTASRSQGTLPPARCRRALCIACSDLASTNASSTSATFCRAFPRGSRCKGAARLFCVSYISQHNAIS